MIYLGKEILQNMLRQLIDKYLVGQTALLALIPTQSIAANEYFSQ